MQMHSSRLPLTDGLIAGVGANLCWTLAVAVPILLPNLDVPMLTAGRYLLLGCISALLLLRGGFPRLHARDRGGDLVLAHLLTAITPRPFEIVGFLLSITGVLLTLRLGRHTQSLG